VNRRDEVRALALAALAEVESNIDKFIDRTDLSEGPDGTEALTAAFALILSAVVVTGFTNGAGRFAAVALPIESPASDSPKGMMMAAHPSSSAPFMFAAAANASIQTLLDDGVFDGLTPAKALLQQASNASVVLGATTMLFHESSTTAVMAQERELGRKHFDLTPMDVTGAGR